MLFTTHGPDLVTWPFVTARRAKMWNSRACCTLYFICACKEYSYVINAASLCTHFSFLILNYLQRIGNIDKNTETFHEE